VQTRVWAADGSLYRSRVKGDYGLRRRQGG